MLCNVLWIFSLQRRGLSKRFFKKHKHVAKVIQHFSWSLLYKSSWFVLVKLDEAIIINLINFFNSLSQYLKLVSVSDEFITHISCIGIILIKGIIYSLSPAFSTKQRNSNSF